MWWTVLCIVGVVSGSPMTLPEYDAIVIGMGASGTMAATTLAKAGKKVLALEAQDRIGGRVKTVQFGDGIVELGAEWIHGTGNSRSYELAVKNNVSLISQALETKTFRSDGSEVDFNIISDLIMYSLGVTDEPPAEPEPLGHFITRRVNEYVKTKYPHLLNDTDFMENYFRFMDQVVNNYEATNSWNDVTTASAYEELEGDQHLSWHTIGYKTLFEILMNTYNGGPGIPSLTVKLNTEVTQVKWPRDNTGPVEVTTKDGTVYKAKHVIVTVSLGVLKERYKTLFNPPLPEGNTRAIEFISFGVVSKITFRFPHRWCMAEACLLIWRGEEESRVPKKDKWLTMSEGISVPQSCRTCGTLWLNGERAKLVEILPEEEVMSKVMSLLRMFMGNDTVPWPKEMIRSDWYSNPFTRGSYSYDNLQTPLFPNARTDLGKPLLDSAGSPRVLFAGEATEPTHFSTVHGALNTGYREASRILQTASKL